jgi:carbamate kinase
VCGFRATDDGHESAPFMLTDVDGVYGDWGKPGAEPIRRISEAAIEALSFESGTMDPEVTAACESVSQTRGVAGIGALTDAADILDGRAGTLIVADSADGPV